MIVHVILCTPRADLTPGDERALAVSLETAIRTGGLETLKRLASQEGSRAGVTQGQAGGAVLRLP